MRRSQPEGASASPATRVPAAIDAFVLTHRVCDSRVGASSRLHPEDDSRSSYALYSMMGGAIADLSGLQTKEMGSSASKQYRKSSADAHASMYATEWQAIEGVPHSGDALRSG